MTTFLLDTHVYLWLLGDPDRVHPDARTAMADGRNTLLVSAASALEVATKARLGRLDAAPVLASWPARLASIDADALAITAEHAILAGTMPWAHRDPFDRLLVAQATIENATLVTVDAAIRSHPQVAVLTW